MLHGHQIGDGNPAGGVFWFLYLVFSLVVAYGAMRIAAVRRENVERANKALKKRLEAK